MQYKLKWIDVLKGLALIVIYIGCLGSGEEITYNFVSTHFAALFFCVLGLAENYNTEKNILKNIIGKVKTVLVPCYILAYVILIMVTIQYDGGLDFIKGLNSILAKGIIRNTFVADSLWLLTCLFCIQLLFILVQQIKYRWLVFAICLVLHCYNVLWMNSIMYPQWCFNVDSALYYLIFYAIGYFGFPCVVSLFELDTKKKQVAFAITGVFAFIYSAGVYFGVDVFSHILPSFVSGFASSLKAIIIIWLYFVLARLLQEVKFLSDIGKNILYLCGSEYILRVLIATVISIFGKAFVINYPIHIFMYIGIAIVLGNKYMVPVVKYLIGKVVREV